MARLMLSDELWSKLRGIMLQHGIYDKRTLRLIVEAMLYLERKTQKQGTVMLTGAYINIAI